MKKLYFLVLLVSAVTVNQLKAEDTIRSLVISEWRGDGMTSAYLELTNMGSLTLDLSKFTLACVSPSQVYPNADVRHQKRLEGSLEPGQSYLIMNIYDALSGSGRPVHRTQMLPLADLKVYVIEGGVVNDSVSIYDRLLRLYNGTYASVLFYHLENGDSVIVDAVANAIDLNTGKHIGVAGSVAGIESAPNTHILIRKANILRGNPDWDNARGVSLEDSEWLPIPHDGSNPDGAIFTTVKVHGNHSILLESSTVGINLTDSVLTVPWGIWKGDSLVQNHLSLGPNMAWKYHESPVAEDSAYNIVRTGDKLTMYALGNQLHQIDFKIMVGSPAQDMALVFPSRNFSYSTGSWSSFSNYYVTNYQTILDTIGNVPFNTRVDSLFKFLHKAPGASWEIIWMDEIERVDLKNGDILRVTAANGSTSKDYYIDVQEFLASTNAQLSSITWPDKGELFLEGWNGDTIPSFLPNKFTYNLELPYGSTNVPALVAKPQSLNAEVKVSRAISLSGGVAERTTVFKVFAQDDTIILEYSVVFSVAQSDEVQEFKAEPFFSQIIHSHRNQNSFLEITNPGNVPISLDEYIVIRSIASGSPGDALREYLDQTEISWNQRYNKYVPGYRFQSLENWMIKPGLLDFDPVINPSLNPGEVFVIGRLHTNPDRRPAEQIYVDIHFSNNLPNAWGEVGFSHNALSWVRNFSKHYIFKIENDSILEGKKPVGSPEDYRLVDMFGSDDATNWNVAGYSVEQDGWNFIRKPQIWKGNPNNRGSWGTTPDDSEWIVVKWGGSGQPWEPISEGLGSHSISLPTVYISTISSLKYLVSDGFTGIQTLQGDLSGTTLQNFYEFIIKADTGQVLRLKSGTDGSDKVLEDLVAGDDTLSVISADGNNRTNYVLINKALDSNAVLTAAPGSGYTIEISGNQGTISGMSYGVSLKEVVNNVVKPEYAILNVVDSDDQLVPMQTLNYDTLYMDTKAGKSHFIEVVAQDGITVIIYQILPNALSSDAYVISTLYYVDQEEKIISGVPVGTAVNTFIRNVEAAGNGTLKITDKKGLERNIGVMNYDDRLVVTSEDLSKTVTYHLDFINESNPDRPEEPNGMIHHSRLSNENLIVYPNPTQDRFYLKNLSGEERIFITDIMGRTVRISGERSNDDGISLSDQPAGVYVITAVDRDNNIRRVKIIKK